MRLGAGKSPALLLNVVLVLTLVAAATAPAPRAETAYSLTEILAKEPLEPAANVPDVPLRLVRVELASSEGWSGALDDRWHGSDAFYGTFRNEFLEGLAWYLQKRGFTVTTDADAVVLKVTIEGFEGRKRFHDDGGDLRGRMTLLRGGKALGSRPLVESLSYEDESDERPAFAKRYGLGRVRFATVLFYRLSLGFYRSIEAGVVETLHRHDAAGPDSAAPAAPGETPEAGTGLLTIESVPDTAELQIDGNLVATTPALQVRLPAGPHTILIRKKGYRDWQREVMVIAGNDVTLKAMLEEDTP